MLPEYSESYEDRIEIRPRTSFAFTVIILALIMMLSLLTADASNGLDQAQPIGETQRGWLACWKKADQYRGQGHIVWDYTSAQCVELGR